MELIVRCIVHLFHC